MSVLILSAYHIQKAYTFTDFKDIPLSHRVLWYNGNHLLLCIGRYMVTYMEVLFWNSILACYSVNEDIRSPIWRFTSGVVYSPVTLCRKI